MKITGFAVIIKENSAHCDEKFHDAFSCGAGAEAVKKYLEKINTHIAKMNAGFSLILLPMSKP